MKRFYDDITDFIFIEDEPVLSDVILIPGSSCSETSAAAAALYLQGYAPWVLPSGRYSLVAGSFPIEGYDTEWEYMKDLLMRGGVPEERILREDRATFTWENAIYSRDTLAKAGIEVKQALICCKAFHERRAYTYYQQQFPDVRLRMIPKKRLIFPTTRLPVNQRHVFLKNAKVSILRISLRSVNYANRRGMWAL